LTDQTPLSAPAYIPGDLDRFIDLLGGALVPHDDSVLYAATTRDGTTACQDSMLWLVHGGQSARCAPVMSAARSSGRRNDGGGGGPQAYRPRAPSRSSGVHSWSSTMQSMSL
jgi:hypothetical protein